MYEHHGAGALDYFPCRYGKSKVLFRGPKRSLKGPFCAMIGGSETYGKFVDQPFPALVEQQLGLAVVNLGCVNAGLDVFTGDDAVLEICAKARVSVVQVLGAQNMTNRFYSVHPRRNDRFLQASEMLKAIYREVDFTEFHFTRHMLKTLHEISPERFQLVLDELKMAWVGRMRQLAARTSGKTVLLWVSQVPYDSVGAADVAWEDPLFIDQTMIDAVRPLFTEFVSSVASPAALGQGIEGMIFSPLEQPAAMQTPGPAVHDEVAEALAPVVAQLM